MEIIMDYQLSSTSRINGGMPLLPPLVTNDITTEIQYYQQLSIAVEERLKALKIIRKATLNRSKNESDKDNVEVLKTNNNFTNLDNKSKSADVSKDMASEITSCASTKDDTTCLIDFGSDIAEKDKSEVKDIDQVGDFAHKNGVSQSKQKQMEQVDRSLSEEAKNDSSEILLGDSICSDTITASTDLNQYLNTSVSSKTDTTETTPENWKPQVPKTLNIVPITVDPSKLLDKSDSVNGETPKLVRSGSYVLDKPSPVLLAHMQNEFPRADYKPTIPSQVVKRKEWNISQIKADLKAPANVKESKSRLNSASKSRRSNYSNIPCQRVCKSVSNSKTGSPMDIYQTKSVDCIQSIFAKECNKSCRTPTSRTSNHKFSSPVTSANNNRNNGFKKSTKNSSILNLANKLSESLGSLNGPKPVKRPEKKNDKDSSLNKGFDQDTMKNNENIISNKPKPVITSEKIVTVFKEIQDTHKKQMIELMSRQQKEQIQMQENFKKQQILLLAQIRKAFPEISISALTEAISHKNVEHTTPLSSKIVNDRSESISKETSFDKPQINGVHCNKQDQEITSSSLSNFQCPSRELTSSASCHLIMQSTTPASSNYQNNYQTNQNYDDAMFISYSNSPNVKSIDDIPVGSSIRRRSSVSRQLFPLENKTTYQPVLDNTLYTEKHIKAATIINAYVKGFLVRRLMKTEKVIALKNTYREALHCMLRLHIDAPLNLPELNFHQRLQLQCDAASMNIVDLFSQSPAKRMEIIAHDREVKRSRSDRPSSARSYSFATQRTLARKKMKEMGVSPSLQSSVMSKSCPARTRCQTWASNTREKKITTSLINHGIKRSTSAGAVRKPWR